MLEDVACNTCTRRGSIICEGDACHYNKTNARRPHVDVHDTNRLTPIPEFNIPPGAVIRGRNVS